MSGHGGPVKALATSQDGRKLISGSFDYSVVVWDLKPDGPAMALRYDDLKGPVNTVAFVPGYQHRILLGGDAGDIIIHGRHPETTVVRLTGHAAKIVGMDVSSNGKIAATASWDRTVRLWNLETKSAGAVLGDHNAPVNDVGFSTNGDFVYSASTDGVIRQFETASGKSVRPVHKHGWGINVLHVLRSQDGQDQILFGALDGSVGLVDPTRPNTIRSLNAHSKPVLAIAVSSDAKTAATASSDGVVKVWDTTSWRSIATYPNPYGPIWALAFARQNSGLYYGGLDDDIHHWVFARGPEFQPVRSPLPRRFQGHVSDGGPDNPITWGKLQFARKCSVCHTLEPDGKNRAGPTLHGIFGRRIATLPGYRYSRALKTLDIVWTPKTVSDLFEFGPDKITPGSKMPLQKINDPDARAALIAYLESATAPEESSANNQKDRANTRAKTTPGGNNAP